MSIFYEISFCAMVLITHNDTRLALRTRLPEFQITDIEGRVHTASDFRVPHKGLFKGAVIAFTCNHCPYVQAYEDRMIRLARETLPQGIFWLAVNANAANPDYAEDSVDEMRRRAAAKKIPFAYAADMTQTMARAFGAACTPEYYLFDGDGLLAYSGRLDDAMEENKVRHPWLRDALTDLLEARPVAQPQSHPIGCSIKWL